MRRLPLLLSILLVVSALPLAAQIRGANGMKKGGWKPQDVPQGWKVYNIGRYEFQSDAPADRVKRIGEHLNVMFRTYKKMFPTGRTPSGRFVIKIFKNREGFREYGAPPGAGAYYSWTDKEMVGYDTGLLGGEMDPDRTEGTTGKKTGSVLDLLRKKHTMDTLGAFTHEGWHQYFHWYCTSKIDFPSWCDEGIAEYFYPTTLDEKKKPVLGHPNTYRLDTIKRAIQKEKHIPLEQLVTFNQRSYYRVAGLAYAQGWSVVHFFMEHPQYKKKRYVQRFVKTFVDKHDIEKAVTLVFGRMDWEKVEADWKEWVLELEDPDAEAIAAAKEAEKDDALADLPPELREALKKALEKQAGGEGEGPPEESGKTPEGAGGSGR
jgi:hypothetical protein